MQEIARRRRNCRLLAHFDRAAVVLFVMLYEVVLDLVPSAGRGETLGTTLEFGASNV